LGRYASGITVIAGFDGHQPVGFTCQSFYSISVVPPLISFSAMCTSTSYPRIREAGKFSVNVLSQTQHAVSDKFASKGGDKWAGVEWSLTQNHNPVITGSLMWLDCNIHADYEAGDHHIVVGRVNEMSSCEWHECEPLLYFNDRHLRAVDALAD
jgi:flavin reductase (DIM6/NTAB) family NADH-FMN oxidoreductase RutF